MSSDAKTTFESKHESVGDKLGYEKDSKERLPWEHYLSQYRKQIQRKLPQDLAFLMMKKRSILL